MPEERCDIMLTKNECRQFINSKRQFLNLRAICSECGVAQSHLSMFLKADYYDHYLNVEKLNKLVDFIKNL